jgi:hypothetical protein
MMHGQHNIKFKRVTVIPVGAVYEYYL